MSLQDTKTNMLRIIIVPGIFESVLAVLLMGMTIFLHQIPAIEQDLQLPAGFSVGRLLGSWLDKLLTAHLGESWTETLVVGLFWAVVGLGVYLLLQGIASFATEVSKGFEERGFLWPKGTDPNHGVSEAVRRAGFQISSFSALLVVTFGPLQRLWEGPVFEKALGTHTILQFVVWFLVGLVAIHLWVVLLRLTLLRSRLFS